VSEPLPPLEVKALYKGIGGLEVARAMWKNSLDLLPERVRLALPVNASLAEMRELLAAVRALAEKEAPL
jgi:hypothetical protein